MLHYKRLVCPSKGVSACFMHQFYISIAVPHMLYRVDIFLAPLSHKGRGSTGIISKLARVQRLAAIHITGAMYTTATDTLDAHAGLLPFNLLIDKKCHDEATRLATLPDNHSLYLHTLDAVRTAMDTSKQSPLYRLLYNTFAICPEFYKNIQTV